MTAQPDAARASGDMTIKEVAAAWGVSRRTVRRRVASGSLPMRKVGYFTFFSRDDVAALAPRKADAPDEPPSAAR